jgi:hypothetical protein
VGVRALTAIHGGIVVSKREAYAAEIDKYCRGKTGKFNIDLIIEKARDPKNILHQWFEWDNAKNIRTALEMQARELVRYCGDILIRGEGTRVFPRYISHPHGNAGDYVRTVSIAKNADLTKAALTRELSTIKGAVHRAISLAIVFGVEDKFKDLMQSVIDIEKDL